MTQPHRNDLFDKLHKLPISRSGDRAPRMSIKLRANVQIQGEYALIEALTVNISRSGVLITIGKNNARKLSLDQVINIHIDLDRQFFAEVILAQAKVIRITETNDQGSDTMWLALKFT